MTQVGAQHAAHAGANPRPHLRGRWKLGMFAVCAVLAMTLGELMARRLYGPGFNYLIDPLEDHSYRPMAVVQHEWGSALQFRTNSLGWKDVSSRAVLEKPLGRRIVVLGDSFVEGVGLAADNTVPAQLERELRRQGRPAEVLNGGLSSFCPLLYYKRLERFYDSGYRASDIVVLVDLSDFHDELYYGPRFTYSPSGEPVRVAGWRNHSAARFVTNNSALVRTTSTTSAIHRTPCVTNRVPASRGHHGHRRPSSRASGNRRLPARELAATSWKRPRLGRRRVGSTSPPPGLACTPGRGKRVQPPGRDLPLATDCVEPPGGSTSRAKSVSGRLRRARPGHQVARAATDGLSAGDCRLVRARWRRLPRLGTVDSRPSHMV
jgi:hypothetical protein